MSSEQNSRKRKKRVAVIGGGAAGMMAAIRAAEAGADVTLFEKNEKLGKKIFITGKGRCNLTNACAEEDFREHVCSNGKFLYSSFSGFTNHDAMNFFEQAGLRLKTERGNRVFPVSDHSSDVIAALSRELNKAGVRICLNTAVKDILVNEKEQEDEETGEVSIKRTVSGVRLQDGTTHKAEAVIVCTGGLSYASTGSTGDGFRFAREQGHTITTCSPSLVPMNISEADCMQMQGLSLKNVRVQIKDGKKCLYDDFGEMMFTHFGVTGPLILSASAKIQKQLAKKQTLSLHIDLKPAITDQQLKARFLREFEGNQNKMMKNILGALYPAKMIPVILERSGVSGDLPVHELSKQGRSALIEQTKNLTFTICGLRGYNEAIITRGGVSVKEIMPDTMESKRTAGLYFAGEVLDLDAVTGGYNLQIAWSTGNAAGNAAGRTEV